MLNPVKEFENSPKITTEGYTMTLSNEGGSESFDAVPIDLCGFGVNFTSPKYVEVGTIWNYNMIETATAKETGKVKIQIVRVETLKLDEHIVGAIFTS